MRIDDLLRPNIRSLVPYSCARSEFNGDSSTLLDANENYRDITGSMVNRYPDPLCLKLRQKLEEVMGLKVENTLIGNGSDEIMDNLLRMFCEPGKDKVIIQSPTYGEYKVLADINDVEVLDVGLKEDFSMDIGRLKNQKAKLLFICSPNNPTGNAYGLKDIEAVCSSFDGITIVDEAYFEFSRQESAVGLIRKYPNLVVLRTLSKAWAQAGSRIGILVADPQIVKVMAKVKHPYNISSLAQRAALQALDMKAEVMGTVQTIIEQRNRMKDELEKLDDVLKVFDSQANFLLVRMKDGPSSFKKLMDKLIIVRDRSSVRLCGNCLRITIGSEAENTMVLEALK